MPQEVIEITEREIEIIEVIERGPVGPQGPQPDINYEVVSSARTLEAADLIAADTSGGALTLTLPANPSNGDAVDIFDFSETFDTNPLTIARNGQPIESLNEDLVANVEGAYFTLIYTGATRGWQVLPRYGGGGGSGGELTTEGDILYRGPAVNTRLGIGTAGQILKVNSTATAPEWGAAPDSIDDYTVVTTSQTLTNGARIAADTTSGSFTLTLPSTPQGGDTVYILDYAQTFDTNNLTLARNGSNIEGLAENMTCNVEGSSFKMVFTGASTGWQMIPYYGTGVAIGSNATDVLSLSSGQIVADDPAADRLVFWDDSESKLTYLQAGSGLTISGTTISASGGDTVTIDASAADILSATSGAISADDAGSDKIVFWDDSESKLAYGSVGDVGAAAASHTHAASDITSGSFGNISHDGKIGSTAGLPVVTTTAGAVSTLALGAAGTVLTVNGTADGVEFAAASGGVSAIGTSAADILSVSGSDLVADDPNADRLVMYDDSASKLTHATAGKGLSFDGTTLNSAQAFPVDPISRGATYISYLGHASVGNSSNTVNVSGGYLPFSLVYVPKSANYTTFTCIVSVAGSASSLGKMALYTINAADALPDALVCESGTFAADTTGIKQPTMASTFVSEGWYYMAIGTNSTTNMNFTGDVMTSLRGKFAGSAGAAPLLLDFSQKLYADLWPNPWNGTNSTFRNAFHPITSLT